MRRFAFLLGLSLCALGFMAQAQNINSAQVSGSFQVDAQYYGNDIDLNISDSTLNGKRMGINGFGRVNYSLGNFSAGIRYEACLTPLSGFDARMQGYGLSNLWAKYDNGTIGVTIGDFYEQFGNGLIFRTYEEWTLGYDNALKGMRVVYRPVQGVTLKGVYGSQRFFWESYNNKKGIVRGMDAEWDLNQSIKGLENAKLHATFGGSVVSKYQPDYNVLYNLPENVAAFAGRANLNYGRFAFSTEYAYKINDPSYINNYIYKEGQSVLANLSYSQKGLGLVLQVKRVDNMSFKSDYAAEGSVLDINFIPPINRTHTYSLSSLYPYATQPNGEMATQFQVNYKIPKGSFLGGKYGTGLSLNFSQVNDIVRDYVDGTSGFNDANGTVGYTSPFFGVSDHIFFRDLNVAVDKKINKEWKVLAEYVNLYYDIATIEGHAGMEPVKAQIGIIDLTYRFAPKHSMRLELQGLWGGRDKNLVIPEEEMANFKKAGNWCAALLEYTIAPNWFVALSDKYNYGNPVEKYRQHYYSISGGFVKDATRISLTAGRQNEGMLCVGGVCRLVPASSGLTLTVTTSF
jgi:hypothetical protein